MFVLILSDEPGPRFNPAKVLGPFKTEAEARENYKTQDRKYFVASILPLEEA